MLLNAATCQGYSFYRFWVIKGNPTGRWGDFGLIHEFGFVCTFVTAYFYLLKNKLKRTSIQSLLTTCMSVSTKSCECFGAILQLNVSIIAFYCKLCI